MAQRQVRKRLAGITTALGLAVLLAGPASTFGLGVPGVGSDSATSTVQGAVETTQQTAATTVSNVETTVQTTVQTTTAVPQAVTNQVQSTAGAVRPAPAAAAPVQQPVTKAAAPRKATTKTSAPAAAPPPAQRAAVPVREVGGRSATARSSRIVDGAKRVSRAVNLSAGSPGDAPAPPPLTLGAGCQQLLQTLPAVLDLNALVTVACNTGDLLTPGRIGISANVGDPLTTIGGLVGTIAKRLRTVSDRIVMPTRQRGGQYSDRALPTAAAGQAGSGVDAGRASDPGRATTLPFGNGVPTGAWHLSEAHAGSSSASHHHHGFFSAKPPGTEILSAILIVNLAILAGVAMWRVAARWVIPRFA